MLTFLRERGPGYRYRDRRANDMVAYLRDVVLAPPCLHERGHAIFVDRRNAWVGEASFGRGSAATLTVRIRSLFKEALRIDAAGMIIAHSHPSGHCRPSGVDIAATRRLSGVARALDITLVDHLIVTTGTIYSMRAGGLL